MIIDTTHTLWMGCKKVIHTTLELEQHEDTNLFVAEPKYDGIFGAIVQSDNHICIFSRTAKRKELPFPTLPIQDIIIVGELAFGTQEGTNLAHQLGHTFINVFDILSWNGHNIMDQDYAKRRNLLVELLKDVNPELKEWYQLAPQWSHHFVHHFNAEHEGLVLKRKTSGPYIKMVYKVIIISAYFHEQLNERNFPFLHFQFRI